MKVSINIVTYNAIKYLDDCLRSVFNQTYRDFKILVVDNGSQDGTVEHLRRDYPEVTVLQNFKNLGFCQGNNQAIKFWESEFVLLLNQDVILAPDWLEKIIAVADARPKLSSLSGKVLKINSSEAAAPGIRPEIIDTTGIFARQSRRFYDRGAGEEDKGQYQQTEEVFGLSGNLVLLRRAALEAVKIKNRRRGENLKFTAEADYYEYLDEDFFMYKDDVDLAWRLQSNGWSALYLPTAEAYHYRTGFGHAAGGNLITWR
ncbi:MAG: glycosyltransferase family 2 protein, partial [Patescibacteria group bacterium]